MMEVFVLGCGGTLPLPSRHLTSILIRREGESFLFDCGEGTQIALKKADLRWKGITSIFISHTHADHVTGLPGMIMLSSQVQREEPLTIFGPPRTRQFIESMCSSLEMYINYPLTVNQIEAASRTQLLVDHPEYQISCFPVYHSRPCVGYCFEEKAYSGKFFPEKALALKVPKGPLWSKLQGGEAVTLADGRVIEPAQILGPSRPGRKVCFLTDTLYNEAISPSLANSDLVICEGMYAKDMSATAHEKKHMTAVEAASLANLAGGVKQLGLIHFSPRYTNFELKQLEEEAQQIFPNSFLCRDRMCIELPLH